MSFRSHQCPWLKVEHHTSSFWSPILPPQPSLAVTHLPLTLLPKPFSSLVYLLSHPSLSHPLPKSCSFLKLQNLAISLVPLSKTCSEPCLPSPRLYCRYIPKLQPFLPRNKFWCSCYKSKFPPTTWRLHYGTSRDYWEDTLRRDVWMCFDQSIPLSLSLFPCPCPCLLYAFTHSLTSLTGHSIKANFIITDVEF